MSHSPTVSERRCHPSVWPQSVLSHAVPRSHGSGFLKIRAGGSSWVRAMH
nr:MAG TPA: hypothetical protein [Caudoviricetes sp.]